jgi:hypothetical protein
MSWQWVVIITDALAFTVWMVREFHREDADL